MATRDRPLANIPTWAEQAKLSELPSEAEDSQDNSNDSGGDTTVDNGESQTLVAHVPHRKQRPKTSAIHSQCSVIEEEGTRYYKCNHCRQRWKYTGETSAVVQHLKTKHQWDPKANSIARKRKREETDVMSVFSRAHGTAQALQEERRHRLLKDMINKEMLEYLYLRWTTVNDIPFVQVEHHDFRVFLDYINLAANEILPNSHNTIRAKALHLFQEGKTRI